VSISVAIAQSCSGLGGGPLEPPITTMEGTLGRFLFERLGLPFEHWINAVFGDGTKWTKRNAGQLYCQKNQQYNQNILRLVIGEGLCSGRKS
jgi:hypothetical protein